jgi:hypothetical protein
MSSSSPSRDGDASSCFFSRSRSNRLASRLASRVASSLARPSTKAISWSARRRWKARYLSRVLVGKCWQGRATCAQRRGGGQGRTPPGVGQARPRRKREKTLSPRKPSTGAPREPSQNDLSAAWPADQPAIPRLPQRPTPRVRRACAAARAGHPATAALFGVTEAQARQRLRGDTPAD